MAVSFKVPASPKRNIFVIDNFMGVDLTNTGANIEDTRSPNAENMVRYVPGKVRKRTGYEKDVYFGTKTNVNLAIGTSSREREVIIGADDTGKWIDLYQLIQKIEDTSGQAYDVYIEMDYMSPESFMIYNGAVVPASPDEMTHYSVIIPISAGVSHQAVVKIYSTAEQSLYIKNFAIAIP